MSQFNDDNWQVACGGKEPIMFIDGNRYQLHWNRVTRERAYYDFKNDLFLTKGLEHFIPACLKH